MTEKLYYEDGHLNEFNARVLSCEKRKDGWAIELDRTAFFPEGGGQSADTGVLGSVRVLDAHERDGVVLHTCDKPLEIGGEVTGSLDWDKRFRRMQEHSGEHVVSGIVHSLFGFNNVGFHMEAHSTVVDYDGELSAEQLERVEKLANHIVCRNLSVRAYFPGEGELKALEYRSKRSDFEQIRIVSIEDCDMCACCAPHVSRTGEIGVVAILGSMRHRGGTRLEMTCGLDAADDYRMLRSATAEISAALSVKRDRTAEGVRRLADEKAALDYSLVALRRELTAKKIAALCKTDGNMLLFDSGFEPESARELANAGAQLSVGLCAVFGGRDGDYRFVIVSKSGGLSSIAKQLRAELSARGGGSDMMLQGTSAADKAAIERYFNSVQIPLVVE